MPQQQHSSPDGPTDIVTAVLPPRRRRSESGATATEYALLVGLIAVGILVSVAALSNRTKSTFTNAAGAMPGQPSWVWCANERGNCTVPGTKAVRYGHAASNRWATQTRSGRFGCNNTIFGDPAYGVGKVCQYDANS